MSNKSNEEKREGNPQKQMLLLFGGGLLFLIAIWIAVFTWGVPLVRFLHR